MDLISMPTTLPQGITAIGALGTAAFGLVDASKVFGGSVNHIGFGAIRGVVRTFLPAGQSEAPGQSLANDKILATLRANWFNGTELSSQKAIAKSLIKLKLSPTNAAQWASETGVDPQGLAKVAAKIASGSPLESAESDVYGRFDLAITALLDEAYQRADHAYKNGTRGAAMVVAIVLAVVATLLIRGSSATPNEIGQAVLVGLLATPIAPIAKDLASALATAVNTMQAVRKT